MAVLKNQNHLKTLDDLRRKAELLLKNNPAGAQDNALKDFNALLHELEVHQVELAMQNEELLHATVEIEDAHRKYLDLYDFAPIGYLTYDDRTGYITEINFTGAGLLGFEKGKIIGKKLTHFITPESQNAFYFHKKKCFETRMKQAFELQIPQKDLPPLHLYISSMPVDAHGMERIMHVALVDISERYHMEEKLRQSHKMEAIGTLAGGIAHEFNNVLSGIMNYTELAKDEMPPGRPAHEYMVEVLKLCKRARDVVRQILFFSRKRRVEYEPVAVHAVVAETIKLLRSSLPASIIIRQDIDEQSGIVLGDQTQMHQVLINLCNNAVHAMKQNGGVLAIAVTPAVLDVEQIRYYPDLEPGSYVKLMVSDTGTGLAPAIKERIFDPFFTTKQVGEGTGMGLSVVQGIVKNHGGAITVASTPGEGSTFTVFFPRAGAAADAEEQEHILPGGTERILLVDDEEFNVIPVKKLLEKLGYRVTAMTDSLQALELFRKAPDAFDLVITDFGMPNLTGERLAAEIIKIRKDIPVALASGYGDVADNAEVKKSGIRMIIAKPYKKQELAKSIRYILDGQ